MWTEVQRWTQICSDCKGNREMIRVRNELGYDMDSCTRWCACPPHKLVTTIPYSGEKAAQHEQCWPGCIVQGEHDVCVCRTG